MSVSEYLESLLGRKSCVFAGGRSVDSVANNPSLLPGVNAIELCYDFVPRKDTAALMRGIAEDRRGHTTIAWPHAPRSARTAAARRPFSCGDRERDLQPLPDCGSSRAGRESVGSRHACRRKATNRPG